MSTFRSSRYLPLLILAGLMFCFGLLGAACEQLEEGKCKRDRHCEDMAKSPAEVWVCYKEPPEANMGTCMRVQDARDATAKYEAKAKRAGEEAHSSK